MKIISTLLFSVITSLVLAQPTLTSSQMAPFGSEFYYKHVATFTAIDTSIQGANKVWDFTGVTTTTQQDFTITIFDPSLTVHAASFPSANYAILEGPTMDNNFYVLNSTKYERIGGWDSADGYSIYTDGQIELNFPYTSTSYWRDSCYISGNAVSDWFYNTSLGYGTIKVPGKIYNDVIMARIMLDFGLQLEQYVWYSTSTGEPVFLYSPAQSIFSESAIFLYNSTIGIDENDFVTGLQYNNPCNDQLRIAYVSKEAIGTEYELRNSLGELIRTGSLDSTIQKFTIDLSGVHSGLFFLTIRDKANSGHVKTAKIIKL